MLWNFCDFGAVSCVKTYFLTCLPRKINWNSSKFKSTQVHWRYTKQKRACQGGSYSLPTVIVRPVSVKLFWSLVRWASWIVKCVGRIFLKYYYVLVDERPSGQMSLKNRAMLAVDSWSAESAGNQASCVLSRITSTRCAKNINIVSSIVLYKSLSLADGFRAPHISVHRRVAIYTYCYKSFR